MRLQIRDGRFPGRSDSLKTGLFFGGSRFDVSDLDFFTRFEIVTQRYGDLTPVLALFDGAIHLVDKGRGRPGALVALYRQLDKLGGVDPAYGYTLVYSDDKQLTAPVHHYLHQNLHLTGGRVGQIGPTIGTHVGPGVVGVAFVIPE